MRGAEVPDPRSPDSRFPSLKRDGNLGIAIGGLGNRRESEGIALILLTPFGNRRELSDSLYKSKKRVVRESL